MVDRSNLAQVNALYNELGQIEQGIINLDGGGKISSMDIMGPPGELPATVPAAYIAYPPQMVASIKTALEGRKVQIAGELAALGLTGVGAAMPQRAAMRARAAPVQPRRR
jgi:hypothetical protein